MTEAAYLPGQAFDGMHDAGGDVRDRSDVPPSLGVYKGEADSHLSVAESVGRAKAAVAEPEFPRLARPTFPGGRRRSSDDQRRQQEQQQQ